MRNWHITWFLNKHLSWVLKRTVSPFRWDGSFEHPKQMFELESHSKDSLKVSASCRSSKSSRVDVNWEVHHMSVDLQCFFSECMLVMRGSRGVQLWQCFIIIIFYLLVRASPASLRCGPWARHIYPSLVLVQPMKTRPCLTERLLMGRKESNQTNKTINIYIGDWNCRHRTKTPERGSVKKQIKTNKINYFFAKKKYC